jgi:hypothetical protein
MARALLQQSEEERIPSFQGRFQWCGETAKEQVNMEELFLLQQLLS